MGGFLPTPANRAGVFGNSNVYEIRQAYINAASVGDNIIVAMVSDKKIRVLGLKFSVADEVNITWKSNEGVGAASLGGPETFKAGGGMSDYWGPWGYFFETVQGESLNMYLSAAVQVSGWLNYILL